METRPTQPPSPSFTFNFQSWAFQWPAHQNSLSFFLQLEARRRRSSPHKSILQVHRPRTSLVRQACQGLEFSADLSPVYSCGKG